MVAWAEMAALLGLLTVLTPAFGGYLAAVFEGASFPGRRLIERFETAAYRLCRIDPAEEMHWTTYLAALAFFSLISTLVLFGMLVTQQWLPLNPQHLPNLSPVLALNVAISFVTTTNWQAYSGESTLGYAVQMAGLAWQNFTAAAVGIAVAFAVIRGFTRSSGQSLGNFWVDLTRALLYVLLPLAVIGAFVLVWQGTPQNFAPYLTATTLEGAHQLITGGPIASQTIIEQLGGNGGGFVGANVASPGLNPTPLTDFVQFLAMFAIGAGLTNAFGRLAGNVRQGWTIYAVMAVLFVGGFAAVWGAEHAGNPLVHQLGVSGPNLEGKETRFGDATSALSMTVATDTSSGAANLAYDSLMPLSVTVALINMQVGEIVFGGAGSGLYGMLIVVVLTVFIAGLMVGRTPEYLGKKIGRREITLVVAASLVTALATLIPAAIASLPGVSSVGNGGPRGFSEILYAFTSVAANNGSVLGGLNIQNDFYNLSTSVVMLVGRFSTIAIALALAGGLVRMPRNRESRGLDTATPLFGVLLGATALIVTALTFVPADALGPIAEAALMHGGRTF